MLCLIVPFCIDRSVREKTHFLHFGALNTEKNPNTWFFERPSRWKNSDILKVILKLSAAELLYIEFNIYIYMLEKLLNSKTDSDSTQKETN